MNLLQEILGILAVATQAAQMANAVGGNNPDVAAGASLATALETIAAKAAATYQAQTGTPLDLTKLQLEAHIPMPDSK